MLGLLDNTSLLSNFAYFFVCYFFSKSTFSKNLSVITSECQAVWIQIRPFISSGLIWVQTVCKRDLQMTLVGKELSQPASQQRLATCINIEMLYAASLVITLFRKLLQTVRTQIGPDKTHV